MARRVWSIRKELLAKSRESALAAIKLFNDPLVTFKSESYIVLMVIAWTYLLHAYYRSKQIDYRYYTRGKKRKKYDRTKRGAYKYWELERCLNDAASPVENDAANNLRFLIGLRHEIEHQMTKQLDNYLSGRYQACAMNYNAHLKTLFGTASGLDEHLAYSIQFLELDESQFGTPQAPSAVPKPILAYIDDFDSKLSEDEFNSPKFSYRLLFTRKLVNRPGQADQVVEFLDPKSELAKTIGKEYWVKKEVERPKFRPKDVVNAVKRAGFSRFGLFTSHVDFWRREDAKNPAKGYGTSVGGTWYWYESWVKRCIQLCEQEGDLYR